MKMVRKIHLKMEKVAGKNFFTDVYVFQCCYGFYPSCRRTRKEERYREKERER